jgi:hypothetical protein
MKFQEGSVLIRIGFAGGGGQPCGGEQSSSAKQQKENVRCSHLFPGHGAHISTFNILDYRRRIDKILNVDSVYKPPVFGLAGRSEAVRERLGASARGNSFRAPKRRGRSKCTV